MSKESFWHGYRYWGNWRNPYFLDYNYPNYRQQQINANLTQRLNEEENENKQLQREIERKRQDDNDRKNMISVMGTIGLIVIALLFLFILIKLASK